MPFHRASAARTWVAAHLLALVLVLLALAGSAAPGVWAAAPRKPGPGEILIEQTFQVEPPELQRLASGAWRVSAPGLVGTTEPGLPVLPYRPVRLLLPAQGQVVDITLDAIEGPPLYVKGRVETARAQSPISPGARLAAAETDAVQPLPEGAWPSTRYRVESEQYWHGYRVLLLRLYPIRYDAHSSTLSWAREMILRVAIDATPKALVAPRLILSSSPYIAAVRNLVDNTGDLARFGPSSPAPGAALSTATWDLSTPADMILLTSEELRPAFAPLVTRRQAQGLVVRVYTVEYVEAGSPPALANADRAARLRAFLRAAYLAWRDSEHPLRYVLLGGDSEIIPARPMRVIAGIYETNDELPLVSDAYYAGLDDEGSLAWDADGDGLYGEGDSEQGGTGTAGEEADLLPEVHIGRAPVNEGAGAQVDIEARRWVAKVLAYEDHASASAMARGVWVGEQLDTATYGGRSKELTLPLAEGLAITRLYDEVQPWSATDLLAELGQAHLINHLGHASASTVLRLTTPQVVALDNATPFIVHSQGCLAAAFAGEGAEAIAEAFVTAQHGAVAFVGNTCYGWYLPKGTDGASQRFDHEFIDALFNEGITPLGAALDDAKLDLLPQVGAVGPERWVWLELTLLGDPSLEVVTRTRFPSARITTPGYWNEIAGSAEVRGTVAPGAGATLTQAPPVAEYRLRWSASDVPDVWHEIASGEGALTNAPLGTWDASRLPDGAYRLALRAQDALRETAEDTLPLRVRHARLQGPTPGSYVSAGGPLTITGTAMFAPPMHYRLDVATQSDAHAEPGPWRTLFSSTTPVVDDILGVWDTSDILQAGRHLLRLTLEGENYQGEDTLSLYLDPTYRSGWPQTVPNRISNESLAVGDIDGDGYPEVVATEGLKVCGGALADGLGGRCGSYGMGVYAWPATGNQGAVEAGAEPLLPGFPVMPGSDNRLTTPALADLDGPNGAIRDALDIIVGSVDGLVYAYDGGGRSLPGWPQRAAGPIHAAPACADLDGDGLAEVVAVTTEGHVHVWSGAGEPLPGWPQAAGVSPQAPLLLDFDRDGALDILVVDGSGSVHLWRADGAPATGYPLSDMAPFYAAPSAADVDGDGWLDAVVVSLDGVHIMHSNGSPPTTWPGVPGSYGSSPALADLDRDGRMEVAYIDRHNVLQIRALNGATLSGGRLPIVGGLSSPVAADIDGDGDLELLLAGDDRDDSVYAFHHDGTPVSGWPRAVPSRDTLYPLYWDRRCGPTVADLDGDGGVDLFLGVENYVFGWELAPTSGTGATWPTFRGNVARTGVAQQLLPRPYTACLLPLVLR